MSEYLNDKSADKADEIIAGIDRNCGNCSSYIEKDKDCSANSNVLRDAIVDVNQPPCGLNCWTKKGRTCRGCVYHDVRKCDPERSKTSCSHPDWNAYIEDTNTPLCGSGDWESLHI